MHTCIHAYMHTCIHVLGSRTPYIICVLYVAPYRIIVHRMKRKKTKAKTDTDTGTETADDAKSVSNSESILDGSNYIGPITDKIIRDIITEIRKDKNINRIKENILDPVLLDINNRYFPHMLTLISLLIMIVVLLVILLIISMSEKK